MYFLLGIFTKMPPFQAKMLPSKLEFTKIPLKKIHHLYPSQNHYQKAFNLCHHWFRPSSINSTLSDHSFIFYSLSYMFRAHSINSNSIFILIIDSYMYKLIHHDFAYWQCFWYNGRLIAFDHCWCKVQT